MRGFPEPGLPLPLPLCVCVRSMDYKLDPGLEYANASVYFTSRIKAINGKTVTLERALPWAVKKEFEPGAKPSTAWGGGGLQTALE